MSQNYQYNTIEEALRNLKEGKIVLVTDDPDRENEGDLICAAEFATRENINFMATYAKGLICTPMSAEIAARLNFPPGQRPPWGEAVYLPLQEQGGYYFRLLPPL